MKKIETIWHHLLYAAHTEGRYRWTQQELARDFGYSLSTVHHALEKPCAIGSVRKESKFFVLEDAQKLLYYWASVRALERDILAASSMEASVHDIEGWACPGSIFACFSAAARILREPPADYDTVHFYVARKDLASFRERFPAAQRKKRRNVIALAMPEVMTRYGGVTTLPQTFVDCWNLPDWYAREFCNALERLLFPSESP